MKKKLLWIIGIPVVIALIATLIGPSIILSSVRQPAVAESYAYSDSFYESYDEIRVHLQELTSSLGTEISSYAIDENRNHWYPTDNATSAEIVRQNYLELYYPTETAWREKTVEDFKTAATGVLHNKLK